MDLCDVCYWRKRAEKAESERDRLHDCLDWWHFAQEAEAVCEWVYVSEREWPEGADEWVWSDALAEASYMEKHAREQAAEALKGEY